jgi:hnRNP-L/PTB/hephaestus splicing factor
VVVENLLYSVSLEILHSVFSRAGKVSKIVTFTKNGAFQALIQFQESSQAIQAKQLLDGQNLFHAANTLRIEFSKLQQLNVKYNNDKSRDYTNPSLPSMTTQSSLNDVMSDQSLMTSLLNSGHHSQSQQQLFANPFAVNQSLNSLRALNPLHALQQLNAHSNTLGQLGALGALGTGLGPNGNGMQSSVLLVSNLNESVSFIINVLNV